MLERRVAAPPATTLVDILDKVLDKGLVVAGDIRVSLANVELLTIQIRLLVCSIDKAQEIGLDWWRNDTFLSAGGDRRTETVDALQARIEALERQLAQPQTSRLPSRTARQRAKRAAGDTGRQSQD